MVKKYLKVYFVILLVALLFLSSCSNSSVEKDSKTVNTDSNIQEYNNNNENNDLNEDNTNNKDNNINDNVVLENTIEHCYTYDDSQNVQYEFYISKDKLYEKTYVKSNDDFIIKVWSNNEICTLEKGEETQCIEDKDKIFYNEIYEAYDMFAKQMKDIVMIRCEEIPYDETVFEIKV